MKKNMIENKIERIALFAGTFDPVTIGHVDIVRRALLIFDRVVVGIGVNEAKTHMFSLQEREDMLNQAFLDFPGVSVTTYTGMTVEHCKKVGATHLLRGLRNTADLEYEHTIIQVNNVLDPSIETIFILSSDGNASVSSTAVREMIKRGENYKQYIPF